MNNDEPNISVKDLAPQGAYKKSPSENLVCENPQCGKETPALFGVPIKEVDNKGNIKEVEKKYCEACYNEFWHQRGWKP